jgi:hypothetical protein
MERIFMSEWEQLEDESDTQYSYFMAYLKMGPSRSLRKLERSLVENATIDGLSPIKFRQLSEYSRLNDWVKRASAYDDTLNKEIIERTRKLVIQEEEEMANIRLKFIKKLDEVLDMGDEIHPSKKPYWYERLSAAMDREMQGLRLHRGLATERAEVTNTLKGELSFEDKIAEAKKKAIERRKENEQYDKEHVTEE